MLITPETHETVKAHTLNGINAQTEATRPQASSGRLAANAAWLNSNERRRRVKQEGRGARARRSGTQGKQEGAQTLWRTLYADDARVLSSTPNGFERLMCSVRADDLGDEDRDHVPAKGKWGASAIRCQCSQPGVQTNGQSTGCKSA